MTGREEGGKTPAGEVVTFRYYFNSEVAPVSLKAALEKAPGVSSLTLDPSRHTMTLTWSRECTDLYQVELLAVSAGVPALMLNHTHVFLAFKPLKGADLERLNFEIGKMSGVKGVLQSGVAAELHADLTDLTLESIREAAKATNFEAQIKSHQWVELKLGGDQVVKLRPELENLLGVLVVRSTDAGLGFWALKSLSDTAIKKAAEKAGVALGEIGHP